MKTVPVLVVATLALAGSSLTPAHAGDREWAVAGKVLTGVVAAGVIAEAFRPAPVAPTTAVVYQAPPTVVYQAAPAVVYHPAPPPQVIVAPPPVQVVYYSAPAVVAPAPVYVRPVCYRPVPVCAPPVVSVSFGFGPRFGHHHHHHGWR